MGGKRGDLLGKGGVAHSACTRRDGRKKKDGKGDADRNGTKIETRKEWKEGLESFKGRLFRASQHRQLQSVHTPGQAS